MGDDTGQENATQETAASPTSPGPKSRKRRNSGILAHLPPVPEPVDVDVKGLSPKKTFYGWLLVVVAILVAGIALNWVLTDGEWVAAKPQLANPDAAYGETPVQFLTATPYDVLTATLFTISILLLGLSLVTRSPAGAKNGKGVFLPLALTSGGLAAAAVLARLVGPHLSAFPRFAAFAAGSGPLIAAVVLALLGAGFLLVGAKRDFLAARRHEIRGVGWLVFAAHWALTGMYYYVTGGGDWVNMAFSYAAVFLLVYFAYQELISRSLGQDNASLRFTAAAVVIAAGVWYVFLRVEVLSRALIETVATHTTWMLQLLGNSVQIGEDGQTGFLSAISYTEAVFPRTVIIILACTAIQSMMIFVAAAFAVKGPGTGPTRVFEKQMGAGTGAKAAAFLVPSLVLLALAYWFVSSLEMSPVGHAVAAVFVTLPVVSLWGVYVHGKPLTLNQRRLLVLAVTVPLVYVLNLARNTGIIIMWADAWLERNTPWLVSFSQSVSGGDASGAAFGIAHNWVGKGGSLIALVVIAFIVFKILPEVLRALVGLLDLPRRRGPLEQYWRELRGHKDPVPVEAPETA